MGQTASATTAQTASDTRDSVPRNPHGLTPKDCRLKIWPYKDTPSHVIATLHLEQEHNMCKNGINPDYFTEVLTTSTDYVLVSARIGSDNSVLLCGFALLQVKGSDLYIPLICANGPRGTGTKMLVRIADFARNHGFARVTLSAVDSALSFYERNGFERDFSVPIVSSDETPMDTVIESKRGHRARKQRDRRRARRIFDLEQKLDDMRGQASKSVLLLVERMRKRAAEKKKLGGGQ